MKRLLMVAFHFPPCSGSSGMQRTLRFARYLPEFGWQPLVLTAHTRAYERISTDQVSDVSESTVVVRAPAFDTARHLSLSGRYPRVLANPDRWVSWMPGAIIMGLAMIRRYKPDAIWSTYPIATAHKIGAQLHSLSGLPWAADFRDPMAQEGYPSDSRIWKNFKKIESTAVSQASLCTFTTPGAVRYYSERYPQATARFETIENGYDEETFFGLEPGGVLLNPGRITLLHSGIIYPSERDPTQFLAAVRQLIDTGVIQQKRICIRFRASMHDDFLQDLVSRYRLDECVELAPPVPYREALLEMVRADYLLVLQASSCNDQIPAKLYEYLRSGKPVLAFTDPNGDTASTLRRAGITTIAPLDNIPDIAKLLDSALNSMAHNATATKEAVLQCSRKNRTGQFAAMLDRLV